MKSKIINMAEHLKDAEDRMLEALFAEEPIPDDGFSRQIVQRIRQKLWLRRVCITTALLLGGTVALQPTFALAGFIVRLLGNLSDELLGISLDTLPSIAMLAGGGILFVLTFVLLQMLED